MHILYMVWNFSSTDSDIHLIHSLVDVGKFGKNKLIPITHKIFWVQHGLLSNNNVSSRSAPPQGGTWPCVDEPMINQNNHCRRSISAVCISSTFFYHCPLLIFRLAQVLMNVPIWWRAENEWNDSLLKSSFPSKKLNISSNSLSLHKGRHWIWAPTGRVFNQSFDNHLLIFLRFSVNIYPSWKHRQQFYALL